MTNPHIDVRLRAMATITTDKFGSQDFVAVYRESDWVVDQEGRAAWHGRMVTRFTHDLLEHLCHDRLLFGCTIGPLSTTVDTVEWNPYLLREE